MFSLLTACAGLPHAVKPKPSVSSDIVTSVFIVSHGWHTGIVMDSAIISRRIPALEERFKNSPWLEIGWGDKGFYQSEEVTTKLTLQAMFWSPGSVLHVVSVPENPVCYFSHSDIVQIGLTSNELESLIEFIENSFARDVQNDVISLKHGIYGDSQFYEGVGSYYILNTCNKWTAKALSSSGVDIWPMFKLTSGSVMNTIKEHPNAVIFSKRSFCPVQ